MSSYDPDPDNTIVRGIVDRAFDKAIAESNALMAQLAPEPTTPHYKPVPHPIEPPQAVVNACIDSDSGRIRVTNTGPLMTIAAEDAQPELVKSWRAETEKVGLFLKELPLRAAALAQIGPADDRALHAAKLLDEIQLVAERAKAASEKAAERMRDASDRLVTAMRAPGGDLDSHDARRLAEHYHRLPEDQRRVFLRRAQEHGDYAALRAIANDPLTKYADAELDTAAMIDTAGRLRSPRSAAMADCYAQLADYAARNARQITELAHKAVRDATSMVDEAKLKFAQRVRQAH